MNTFRVSFIVTSYLICAGLLMIFDKSAAQSYDEWLRSSLGFYIDKREKQLICELLAPREGERLLDIGCKTGNRLQLFKRQGCDVTGIEVSPAMLERTRLRLGDRADLYLGSAEDLPFSDNEFDVVTLMTALEFSDNPERAIDEAIRVSRGRVFIGILNRYSTATKGRRTTGIFSSAISDFGFWKIRTMIKRTLSDTLLRWGSVVFFPLGWYPFAERIEEWIPSMKNPFGSFLGFAFPVVYSHMTVQDPLKESLKVRAAGRQHIPGTARETKK